MTRTYRITLRVNNISEGQRKRVSWEPSWKKLNYGNGAKLCWEVIEYAGRNVMEEKIEEKVEGQKEVIQTQPMRTCGRWVWLRKRRWAGQGRKKESNMASTGKFHQNRNKKRKTYEINAIISGDLVIRWKCFTSLSFKSVAIKASAKQIKNIIKKYVLVWTSNWSEIFRKKRLKSCAVAGAAHCLLF